MTDRFKLTARVENAKDGSDDLILIFPDEFAEEYGLIPGIKIDLSVENGSLLMRKVDEK
jgi:hypothetical protein